LANNIDQPKGPKAVLASKEELGIQAMISLSEKSLVLEVEVVAPWLESHREDLERHRGLLATGFLMDCSFLL
jgi:hypothetical protein